MLNQHFGWWATTSAGAGLNISGSSFAYSVRRLGDESLCMRIRRTNDDAEQDIGFDADGYVDVAAIASFCGTNSGQMSRWYDQSGNGRHLDEPPAYTGTNGASIKYNSTDYREVNGILAPFFDGGDELSYDTSSDAFPLDERFWSIVVGPATSAGTGLKKVFSFDSSIGEPERIRADGMCLSYATFNPGNGRYIESNTDMRLMEPTYATGFSHCVITEGHSFANQLATMYINNVSTATDTSFTQPSDNSVKLILGRGDPELSVSTFLNSFVQEFIWWPAETDLAGGLTRETVVQNQMNYFGVS